MQRPAMSSPSPIPVDTGPDRSQVSESGLIPGGTFLVRDYKIHRTKYLNKYNYNIFTGVFRLFCARSRQLPGVCAIESRILPQLLGRARPITRAAIGEYKGVSSSLPRRGKNNPYETTITSPICPSRIPMRGLPP